MCKHYICTQDNFFDGSPITSTACLVCLCTVYTATAATATQGYTLYILCPYKTRGMDLSNHQLIANCRYETTHPGPHLRPADSHCDC